MSVTVSQSASVSFTYEFTVPRVINPSSMKPTSTFTSIECNARDSSTAAIYKVAVLDTSNVVVTN